MYTYCLLDRDSQYKYHLILNSNHTIKIYFFLLIVNYLFIILSKTKFAIIFMYSNV